MTTYIYAHRGASGQYPENTFPAFHAAYLHGADGLEIDVQLTADGEIIVMHDTRLEHTTNGKGEVRDFTLHDIRRLNAATKHHLAIQPAKVPELSEVLLFAKTTGLKLIIELKNFIVPQPNLEEKLIRAIYDFRLTSQVVISSFNFTSLLRIKEIDPKIRTGLLYFGQLQRPCDIAKEYRADELHAPDDQVTKALIKEAKKHNLSILSWTVDTPARMKELISYEIDGIITNFPEYANKIL
ncbi:glycerophosphodiester phosphodiesterase [Brevibacillus daliensis]|uniref:glycerophosphodiester phosphodiesterase n=1 Tax=Brevibacillus daliensis TaxID=2892995 RepID=UPI001E28F102|nr:glycerophosphodiester phosphodiesterase family protein [Brevibacillus daliensis]